MKNQLTFALAVLFLVALFSLSVNAEMTLWSNVIIDEDSSTVAHHSYYQYYDDIEELSRAGQLFVDLKRSLYAGRTNDVILWAIIENMSYDTGNYTVNYCEYNVTHIKTDYDNDGNLINTTSIDYGFVYSGTPTNTTYLFFQMKNRDSLITDLRCYYNDSDYLYDESILFARGGIYLPANKCNDCEEYTLEELSNAIERTDEIIADETGIYNTIQTLIGFIFQLWLAVFWLIKLVLLLTGVTLIFAGVYYLFLFLRDIERSI